MRHKFAIPLASALAVFALAFCSCSWADNGVEPFGEVIISSFGDLLVFDDISCIRVNGVVYFDVGTAEDGVEKGQCIAAANGRDHYSYRIYKLQDDSLDGIVIVNAFSKINLTDINRIYVSADAPNIPASILFDFPHTDDWWNGGQITEMNGVNYCRYGSSAPRAIEPGEKLFAFGGKDFYAFPNEPLWVMCRNEEASERFNLYYEVDSVKELPIAVFMATAECADV